MTAGPGAAAALADLAWLLLSPPLLADGCFSAPVQAFDADERAAITTWLDGLRTEPAPLLDFLQHAGAVAPPRLPLGRHAERLLEFFLRHGPTHRLVVANLPLRHAPGALPGIDHTTRGEIDFLLEDARGRPLHWELAVKFFLCTAEGETARADDFVGPDRAETLPGKLDKLFGRQLKHRPPVPWDQRGWQPAAYTRGWMFYRHDRPPPCCPLLSHAHLRGGWLEWQELDRLPAGHYERVPRSRWMAAARLDADDPAPLPRQALAAHLEGLWAAPPPPGARRWPTAQLLARLEPDPQGWHETGRWFVVPQGWSDPPQ
ncbi:DUF1853 family protein [Aquabacterium sp. A7-Y]|uniref:DUF1853 family protein n=1 Tax=Aquabacterium sp. A7-Y TaxID=1349605 RepID=UPI00223D8383|nr:DUF1853 family protein [Aquabacterium sp. A7-Y]MCW7539096.1 DUF1853 family protein [Aquabacterium sp. A7-Y]